LSSILNKTKGYFQMSTKHQDFIFKNSFIDGKWFKSNTKATFKVFNPSTQELITEVADDGTEAVNVAIMAAQKAQGPWSSLVTKERSILLEKLCSLILEHEKSLAELMTLESGKPLKESRGEVAYAASFLKWFAEEARRSSGSVIPTHASNKRVLTFKQPIGVVGAITPWNFPLAMITRKVAPALAAGCTVVVRPSEETPLCALALAHLSDLAGFPPGILNVTVGSDSAAMGETLCASETVRKISFTGSTRVGSILMKQCAPSIKRLSLELGGNAPLLVFEDADLDKAVEGAVAAKFRNSGQTCVCVNRILVHEKVYDEFTQKFTQAVGKLKTGDGFETGVDVGPLISQKSLERMEDLVQDAKAHGGQILLGGQKIKGQFFEPTVIGQADSSMKFYSEEIFGPIAPIYKFKNETEAINMANDTIYGLAAYMYSENISRCWRVSEALEYGMVGINEGLISTEIAPFGGVKSSGLGREGSTVGLDEYLEHKYLCFGNI
jgi:succinate-semialdehyde dehydrogenase/glutarate-semialdehyde dehydrogenase